MCISGVTVFTVGAQILLVEVGGVFIPTNPLTWSQWLITIALGVIGIPVGMAMRFIPAEEKPGVLL